jgi:hypothetical protein
VDALDLLFRRLVLSAHAAGVLDRPLEVGEIIDRLAPYGAARRDGKIDSHDDYQHLVIRLVAGERDLVFADDLMQDDLRAELASPNPDLAVLRTYRNASVRLSTGGTQQVLAGDTTIDLTAPTPIKPAAAVRASKPVPVAELSAEPSSGAIVEPATMARENSALFEAFGGTGTGTGGCPYCAQPLPDGRTVKFCPSCGQNLLVKRCPGCSAEIEQGWKFCVTCGRKAT